MNRKERLRILSHSSNQFSKIVYKLMRRNGELSYEEARETAIKRIASENRRKLND